MASKLSDQVSIERDERFQSGGDKRKYRRFSTRLKALYYYYVSGENEGLESCDVINVSYGGLGIQFKRAEEFKELSAINLGIMVKWQFMPISLKGRVKWLSEGLHPPVCGVELDGPLDNITLLKLF